MLLVQSRNSRSSFISLKLKQKHYRVSFLREMLLVKLFLVISLLHFIAAGDVNCDGKYSMFRTRYRKILEIGGNVFMAVSYSLATDENSTEKTTILKKIEKERSHTFMPIKFATEGESAYINVVLDGGDQASSSRV
jgi:hypothetical protein